MCWGGVSVRVAKAPCSNSQGRLSSMAVCATLQIVTQGAENGHKLRYREAVRGEHIGHEVLTAGKDGSLSWFWRL